MKVYSREEVDSLTDRPLQRRWTKALIALPVLILALLGIAFVQFRSVRKSQTPSDPRQHDQPAPIAPLRPVDDPETTFGVRAPPPSEDESEQPTLTTAMKREICRRNLWHERMSDAIALAKFPLDPEMERDHADTILRETREKLCKEFGISEATFWSILAEAPEEWSEGVPIPKQRRRLKVGTTVRVKGEFVIMSATNANDWIDKRAESVIARKGWILKVLDHKDEGGTLWHKIRISDGHQAEGWVEDHKIKPDALERLQ